MKLTVFGATGDTGKHIVEMAVERGHEVMAVERNFPDRWKSRKDIKKFEADVFDDDLVGALEGADAVLSALGISTSPSTMLKPLPLYTESAARIISAMRKAEVKRFISISAAFADPAVTVPMWFRASTMVSMDRIFTQVGDMERVIATADDIAATLVRPGWLLDLPFSDDYQTSLDNLPKNVLRSRRPDVADFMLNCAEQNLHVHERPFIGREESFEYENPLALLPEVARVLRP